MIRIKKIAVPTDCGEKSVAGIRYAISLAREYGAEVVLIHVLDEKVIPKVARIPPEVMGFLRAEHVPAVELARDVMATEVRRADLGLRGFVSQHVGPEVLKGLKLRRIVRIGHTAEEIVKGAYEESCDLIVMASRGRGWLGRLVLGSLSEKVARRAACPVLTIQPSAAVRDNGRWVPVSALVLREEHEAA